jgi:trimethylamine---corrinoid protein Co-methyltransferase
MDTTATPVEGRRGREARRAARMKRGGVSVPYIARAVPLYEVLSEEGLALIEANAETLLQEIGIEFRDHPRSLELLAKAGCDVKGTRVRFPKGLARKLVSTAPREFTQHARNPERSVHIGGNSTVFAPVYGPPFVHDLDKGRRYGTIEDFRNFVKLTYLSPYLHHSGGTVCEPVDLPVNKRHLDMVHAHMRLSDKPFMGSVTHPERARDTVVMCRILFGEAFVEANTVCTSLINANSPMVWDFAMLGSAEAYAEANQAVIITPFILSGAMSPVTVAGTLTQVLAEVLAGVSFVQPCSPARRPSARRKARSPSSARRSSRGASACPSAPAARFAPRRSATRRPRMRARRPCSPPCSPARISCCTRRAGSRAVCPRPTRNS